MCRFMSRSCISAKTCRQITAPVTARNFFCCRDFGLTGTEARMQCHDGMHLLEHWKAICFISDRKLPLGGTALKSSMPNRALSESGFAHDTPATLCMKRQTNYIIVIDICSLRLSGMDRRKGRGGHIKHALALPKEHIRIYPWAPLP